MQKNLKVVLFGPESTGKTSLSMELASKYNTFWCQEFARDYLFLKNKIEHRVEKGIVSIYEDIEPMAIGQISIEDHFASLGKSIIFYDTNLLTNLIYSDYYFGKHPAWLSETLQDRQYDLYLLLSIETPWVYDPLRDRPEAREVMYALFKTELVKRNQRFEEIKGLGQERVDNAINVVSDFLTKQ